MTNAVIGGLFGVLAFVLSQVMFFFTSRKRKTEDLANLIIPRRAELYREFFCAVGKTGIQMLKDEGDIPKNEKIALLHDLCNRSMYELCPYGSLAFLECIRALSEICYRHKSGVLAEKEGAWKAFKNDFMFKFLEMPALARSDCFGPDMDLFMGRNINGKLFTARDMAKTLKLPVKDVKARIRERGIQPQRGGVIKKYSDFALEMVRNNTGRNG